MFLREKACFLKKSCFLRNSLNVGHVYPKKFGHNKTKIFFLEEKLYLTVLSQKRQKIFVAQFDENNSQTCTKIIVPSDVVIAVLCSYKLDFVTNRHITSTMFLIICLYFSSWMSIIWKRRCRFPRTSSKRRSLPGRCSDSYLQSRCGSKSNFFQC